MRLWVKLLALSWVRVASEDWNNHLIIYEKHYQTKYTWCQSRVSFQDYTVWLNWLSFGIISLLKNWNSILTKKEKKFLISLELLTWVLMKTILLCLFWHDLSLLIVNMKSSKFSLARSDLNRELEWMIAWLVVLAY
jgi:hypothetical protein